MTHVPSRRDPLRVRRVVVGVLGWALFAAAWWAVLRRPGAGVPSTVLAVPVTAVVVLFVTTAWIRHNQRIYERKGPRRGLPAVAVTPRVDRLGRSLELEPEQLTAAREVVVDVEDGRKTYRYAT